MRLPFFSSEAPQGTKKVEIYMRPTCSYSRRAIRLLESKGVAFTEINISGDPERRQEMIDRSGGRNTVPQIFVDGVLVGNSDEIADLDAKGGLDTILGLA